MPERPASVAYTLMANFGTSKTIVNLEQDNIGYEEDGTLSLPLIARLQVIDPIT